MGGHGERGSFASVALWGIRELYSVAMIVEEDAYHPGPSNELRAPPSKFGDFCRNRRNLLEMARTE